MATVSQHIIGFHVSGNKHLRVAAAVFVQAIIALLLLVGIFVLV